MTPSQQKIRFFRQRIPAFECIPGCHDCCGPVTTSPEEMARLPRKSKAEQEIAIADLNCVHLGAQGCTVYSQRPLICRLFGTSTKLPCPHGRRPEHWIEPAIEKDIHQFFRQQRQILV